MRQHKSSTDEHWNRRASSDIEPELVNIHDSVQRDLEFELFRKFLSQTDKVLEVGCGNGYVTQQIRELVDHVDAFDFSENMVEQARRLYGERNNSFFQDNVLAPAHLNTPYDIAVCVRVLINLVDLEEQIRAFENIKNSVKTGGRIILVEGFTDGFDALSEIRVRCGMPPLTPAKINFYSSIADFLDGIQDVEIVDQFHLGMFDVLTRIVYPAYVGPENAAFSDFHVKTMDVVRALNPDVFSDMSRVRGFVFRRTS